MKRNFTYLLITGFFLTLQGISQTPSGNWKLLPESSDEFNGSSLDTLKWNPRSARNIKVSGGRLLLTKDTVNKTYTSSKVSSKISDPGNGSYIEIRAKVIDYRANICCAIWEQNQVQEALNPNPEIDIQEFLLSPDPNRVQSTLHRWPRPGTHTVDAAQGYIASSPLCYDFHNYGLERRDGKLRFYLDGFKYWEYNVESMPEYVTMSRHIILSIEKHAGNPVDSYLPAVFQIDYVRIYKYDNSASISD